MLNRRAIRAICKMMRCKVIKYIGKRRLKETENTEIYEGVCW